MRDWWSREAGSGEYRFAHTLIRRTLLDELPTTQRVHMQGRVAEALAAVQSEGDEGRAAELAGHFAESATLGAEHAGRAERYSRIAGERAEAVFATAEAIRHYETGLAVVAEAAAPPGGDAATMMLSLGRCYAAAGQPGRRPAQPRARDPHVPRARRLERRRAGPPWRSCGPRRTPTAQRRSSPQRWRGRASATRSWRRCC